MIDYQVLIEEALNAREYASTPYSGFKVGAALLLKEGNIIKGCNIENLSYGATMCAERVAVFKAISEGFKDFKAIAVVGGKKDQAPTDYCAPCGMCLQVLSEYVDKDFEVILAINKNDYKIYKFIDLLPNSFTSDEVIRS